ncbi:MAG: polyprenol monophosphomannose synthase [Chloroflexota bacterium]|nr:polyprenol monophosphomannose synthase [Chloroflexota bacterium]
MRPAIVVPTYNEAENVRPMAEALLALELPDVDVLIVDDDSPDGTGRIADRLALEYPGQVHVLHRTGQRGLGRAYVDGFRWALERGAAAVVQMDCDFSHAPTDVPRLLARLPEYDVVIGSRYVEGGAIDEDWELERELLSWWANLYARLILRSPIRDITAGFKAWRRETLEGIDLDAIRSQGYIFQVEMAYVASRLGYCALEIPIYFEDRRIGESKMTMPVKVEAALGVWRIWRRHRYLQPSDRQIA